MFRKHYLTPSLSRVMWQSKPPLCTSTGYQVTRSRLLNILLVMVKQCSLKGVQMIVTGVPHTSCTFNQREQDCEQEPDTIILILPAKVEAHQWKWRLSARLGPGHAWLWMSAWKQKRPYWKNAKELGRTRFPWLVCSWNHPGRSSGPDRRHYWPGMVTGWPLLLAGVGENPRTADLGAASKLSLIFPGDFSHPSTAWLFSLTGLMLMVMWTLPSSLPLSWSPTARQKGMKQPSAHQGAFWTKAETFVACKHDEKEDSEWSDMFELTSTPLTSLSSVVCPRKNLRVAGEPLAPIIFHKVFFTGLPGPEHSCLLSFAIVKRLQLCAVYFPQLARSTASFSSVFVS